MALMAGSCVTLLFGHLIALHGGTAAGIRAGMRLGHLHCYHSCICSRMLHKGWKAFLH